MLSQARLSNFDPNRNSGLKNRQQKNNHALREGVLVNNLIKNQHLDESDYLSNVPYNTSIPTDLYSKKEKISKNWFDNPIIPLVTVPLLLLGCGALASRMYKNTKIAKSVVPEEDELRKISRIITINDDNYMVLYMLAQDPSMTSLRAAAAVLAASAGGFVMKNVVDGLKDIWVKKEKADIKRDLEENLIEIEKRSFSGKNKILRNILAESSREIKGIMDTITFKGYNNEVFAKFIKQPTFKQNVKKEKKWTDKTLNIILAGTGTALISAIFVKSMFKNIKMLAKHMEKVQKKARDVMTPGFKELSKNEAEEAIGKLKVDKSVKDYLQKEWRQANGESDYKFEEPHDAMGGTIYGFMSHVKDLTATLYTYIVNPNPQTKNLMLMFYSLASATYLGKSAVEAVKDVQVEKSYANTELELQDRLVQVELKNFMVKKKSYVQPLMNDFKYQAVNAPDKEKMCNSAQNIMFEIKNGPPFVYS